MPGEYAAIIPARAIWGRKRIVKRGSGRTKTEAQRKLREIIRDYQDGQITDGHGYTVAQAVRDWLQYGMSGRSQKTITKCTIRANTHVIPALGKRQLRELSADDVDRWLANEAMSLSTSTLHSVLRRSITRAQARDKVKRNVVLLCDIPEGQEGRPSKSLTFDQADMLLAAARSSSLHAYIVSRCSPVPGPRSYAPLPGPTSVSTQRRP
jgi:hypothetical protein